MYTHRRALLGCVAISPSNWHKLAARTHPCFTWETSIGPIRKTQHALPRQLDALNRDCKLDLLFFEDWFQSRRIHLNVRTREFKWNRQVSNFILLQLVRRREFNLQLCVEVLRIKNTSHLDNVCKVLRFKNLARNRIRNRRLHLIARTRGTINLKIYVQSTCNHM